MLRALPATPISIATPILRHHYGLLRLERGALMSMTFIGVITSVPFHGGDGRRRYDA